jgi:hypothetical protein
MNPMTQMLAQQRINDMHRNASRARVARQAKGTRKQHSERTRRWGRQAQITAVNA